MPADPRVSILKRNGNQSAQYSNYTSAIANANSGDVIIVWGDLDEQIVLKNNVDIWILPGVEIKSGTFQDTIIAPTSGELNCNIYGNGRIKNVNSNGRCIFINNEEANLTIECDSIEGTLGSSSISVYIVKANRFYLTCNKVSNLTGQAIQIGQLLSPGLTKEINLNILNVETGNVTGTPYTGTTAIITRANGFIKIGEIFCRNLGHCLSHREGNIVARIEKLTTKNNYTSGGLTGSTLHIRQYSTSTTGTQKLILYFDEISALTGAINSSAGVEVGEGTGILIGRRIFSSSSNALQIVGGNTNGYVKADEIISDSNVTCILNDFTNQITIDANSIEGNTTSDGGVIFSYSGATFVVKNTKIKNNNSSTTAKGVGLFRNLEEGPFPNVTFFNAKIVSNGAIIFYNVPSPQQIDIKNFGLFGNKDKEDNINFQIGTLSNYIFVYNPDLS